jgi:5-methylcytosine-specific restriction endonuclease McrA
MYWKPKQQALKNARDGKIVNPVTGKPNIAGRCSSCGNLFLEKKLKVDHIDPVVPVVGFDKNLFLNINWTEYIERMFVEVDGYQVLCKECHDLKTKSEKDERKRNNSSKKVSR